MKIDLGDLVGQVVQQLLPQIVTHVSQQLGGNHNAQPQAGAMLGGGATQQPQTNMFGNSGATQQPQTNMFGNTQTQQSAPAVTPEMIQTLITPLAQHEQIKAALVQAMNSMGINALPEARPEQLPALYEAFKNIEAQARQAGLLGGGSAPAGGGII